MRDDNKTPLKEGEMNAIASLPVNGGVVPTIYILHILDTSISMGRYAQESKYRNAVDGMVAEIEKLKADPNANYVFNLLTFDDPNNITFRATNATTISDAILKSLKSYKMGGSTALNDAIMVGLDRFESIVPPKEAAIVSILTDGEENSSSRYSRHMGGNEAIKEKIAHLETTRDFTITFIGTTRDTKSAIRDFGIKENNTVSYDGTAAGMEKASLTRSMAVSSFSKKMSAGVSLDELKQDFYSDHK